MEPIKVDCVEFYARENAKESRTLEYDLVSASEVPTAIFRRGCNVYFAVRFDRNYEPKQDAVRIQFCFGEKPNVLKGTKIVLPIQPKHTQLPKDEDMKWNLALNRKEGNTLTLHVHIPPNAQVGIWSLCIQTNIKEKKENKCNYQCQEDIYILFNPWCKLDDVYMAKESDLKEYVLNETGKIWCGTFKTPKGKRWNFGQFDEMTLPAACFLLDKTGIPAEERGSVVKTARGISAIINADDDDGLLEGKWEGDYNDGTNPHSWSGSTAIMDQYLRTGGKPVKYGQCWVFSGAVVSVCRALGIPCRSVTNYVSAHDTNCSLTVDKYFDCFGNKIEHGPEGDCNDSCWNFHVWNDLWMARPDLPGKYGGWQIIDATPQEKSENMYRCGPASLEAVKRGEVGFLYDTPFVFSEVNADICNFQEDENSDWGFSKLSVNQYHVGRKIVSKNPVVNDDKEDTDLLDITREYKNPEGSEAERLAVYNAVKGNAKATKYYEIPAATANDVFFDLIDIDTVPFGDSFNVVVKLENNAQEPRTISAMLSASSVYYTGATANDIKKSQGTFTLKPGQKEMLKIKVTAADYLHKLVEHSLIKIYGIANVKETKQTWSEEDDFTLIKPKLDVRMDSKNMKVNTESKVTFSFRNPLNMPLTECNYSMEGPGCLKPKIKKFRNLAPNESVTFVEGFTGKRPGEKKILVNFNSKEIQGIDGSITVQMLP